MDAKQHAATLIRAANEELTVCVVGLGYIGLPTAAILAASGMQVRGCDVDPAVVSTINSGRTHIYEPRLDDLVRTVVRNGDLTCATTPSEADIYLLCVPTPIREDKTPDLSYVEAACRSIRPFVRSGNLVVIESTIPPGATEDVVARRAIPPTLHVGADVFVAHCPERVLPGKILEEAIQNDRVVGGVTPQCSAYAAHFYRRFVVGDVVEASARSAELAKLAENAFRDINIAFANELSNVAEKLGADVWEIIRIANRHPRVQILQPGPGVGGHCISVDPWFLIDSAPDHSPLMAAARFVNDSKPTFVADQVQEASEQHDAQRPVIGCLGLAYKPDVDDLRESPSLEVVRELKRRNLGPLMVCEPFVRPEAFAEFALHSLDAVLQEADILVLLTDHTEFRCIEPNRLDGKAIVDTRGAWRQIARVERNPRLERPLTDSTAVRPVFERDEASAK